MKVIGILSSPRGKNSSTRKLVESAMKGAQEAGAETEMIDITKLNIEYCLGCATCHRKGECAQTDDFQEVMDKIMAAEGLVLSSPNYIDNVTGQMKVFMDRMVDAVHLQLLEGKYGFALCTTGGGNEDIVLDYLNEFLIKCGATAIGAAGAAVGKDPASINVASEKAYELGKDLVEAIKEKRRYPEQEKIHNLFKESFWYTVSANRERWASNYEHWVQKGWSR
ncbi:iron-sulfur protein [Methanocella sp. CWC-04]|uniref:Iron-sulfur protein n=1 Tax=Methanooceanicella nereidis TaxID=2052831 RepID=A0AAP2W7K8_9EURY|nr:flavodoxin family protein [Methanocella sp. CWC-04]MCD1295289.1 iron-sulfur protein [Methanocella sp. CWC-04]